MSFESGCHQTTFRCFHLDIEAQRQFYMHVAHEEQGYRLQECIAAIKVRFSVNQDETRAGV